MADLPKRYAALSKERAPRMLLEALALYGTLEKPGAANNPTIIAWAKEVGGAVADVYKADSIPWCGLFMAVVAKRSTWEPPRNPLWALSWSAFGKPVDVPMLGDVLVFTRNGGGHVGIYVGEDATAYHVLGGNQSDAVTITRIARGRLYTARQSAWKRAAPAARRRIFWGATGPVSTNEA